MSAGNLLLLILVLAVVGHYAGYRRAFTLSRTGVSLPGLPIHYGSYVALLWLLPALAILLLWVALDDILIKRILIESLPDGYLSAQDKNSDLILYLIANVADGTQSSQDLVIVASADKLNALEATNGQLMSVACLLVAACGGLFAWRRIRPLFHARSQVERIVMNILLGCALVAVVTTVGIFVSVLYESLIFFEQVSLLEFLFGSEWSPQIALRADQQGASGSFGALPLFAGTALVAALAMLVAAPLGLMSAIYLSEYASSAMRQRIKPALEVLAGIPSVVYGFFAALTVAPFIRDIGGSLGLQTSSESALAAGLVMGIMIIPFISSLADDIIHAVPTSLRDASLALGATKSETVKRVVLRAALPGIAGGMLLGMSRAIGETMIVVMAAGLSANLTANPLESVTTVTVQIVTLLVGDQEFDSPKTLAAFALGLVLFLVTLALNMLALQIVKAYREQYD